jgi:hypothetical protein
VRISCRLHGSIIVRGRLPAPRRADAEPVSRLDDDRLVCGELDPAAFRHSSIRHGRER